MFEVPVDLISTFQLCEAKYNYIKQSPELAPVRIEDHLRYLFEERLRSVLIQFFTRGMSGEWLDSYDLLKVWEKIWFPPGVSPAKLSMETHEPRQNLTIYSNYAATALRKFRESIKTFPKLVYVDEPYHVSLTKEVSISGRVDLAEKTPRGVILTKIITSRSRPSFEEYRHELAGMVLAYRKMKDAREAGVQFYHISDVSPRKIPINLVENDLSQTKYWAQRIATERDFAPRRVPATAICRPCAFREPCWEETEWQTIFRRKVQLGKQ